MRVAFTFDSIKALAGEMRATPRVSLIYAQVLAQLLLLKHKIEKVAASLRPVLLIEHAPRKERGPCGRGADRKRNRIDFALALAQQPGRL